MKSNNDKASNNNNEAVKSSNNNNDNKKGAVEMKSNDNKAKATKKALTAEEKAARKAKAQATKAFNEEQKVEHALLHDKAEREVALTTRQGKASLGRLTKATESLWLKVSKDIYKGNLPPVVFTFERNTKNGKADGYISKSADWKIEGYEAKCYQVTLPSDKLSREPKEILQTLLRLAVLVYGKKEGLNLTSHGGSYYGKHFRNIATLHGLICKEDPNKGSDGKGTIIEGLSGAVVAILDSKEFKEWEKALTLSREEIAVTAKRTTPTAKAYRYTCTKGSFTLKYKLPKEVLEMLGLTESEATEETK